MSGPQKIRLRQDGPERLVGPAFPEGPERTFGGVFIGQGLAAAEAEPGEHEAHALHATFLRPGDATKETTWTVETLRAGRSFTVRVADAYQDDRHVFRATVSLQRPGDPGPAHEAPIPEVPGPKELAGQGAGAGDVADWDPDWERLDAPTDRPDELAFWFRYRGAEEFATPAEARAGLTFFSDYGLLGTALGPHPGARVQQASLDHSLWLFSTPRLGDWHLYSCVSPRAGDGRALCRGHIHDASGRLVAAVAQEGLTRTLRD